MCRLAEQTLIVLALCTTTAVLAAQDSVSTRGGRRALLARDAEIALARSAAPPTVSDSARVLVLADSGYVEAVAGRNGVTCLVNRSWRHALEPHCYDAEGSATVMRIEIRRNELRHRGVDEARIDREIADGIASGRFRLPRRPAVSYMMSGHQLLYNDDGRRVGAWRPHLMIYFPNLTSADVGLPARPDLRVGMVGGEGTAESSLIVIMPAFATPPATAASSGVP
jgi:hypothetical protein